VACLGPGASRSLERVEFGDATPQGRLKAGNCSVDVVDRVGRKQKDTMNTRVGELGDPVRGTRVTQGFEIPELTASEGGIAEGVGYIEGGETRLGEGDVHERGWFGRNVEQLGGGGNGRSHVRRQFGLEFRCICDTEEVEQLLVLLHSDSRRQINI
jgi:hypothetical protein